MNEKQRALLVGVNINNQLDFQASMEELANLAEACELEVAGTIEQNLKEINKAYYIGSGKVEELLPALEEVNAAVVVFNNELSPSQLGNLEEKLGRIIMDRTALILEIFARRAKTRESKLQVEAARLQYILPRLAGSYRSLSRQAGGVGTTTRGVGEKKLELDRRKIEAKITELNRELELIGKERKTRRKRRDKAELPVVALVGYTNAGKSTLMNAMVELYKGAEEKKVLEKNMLFATLETAVRSITLPGNKTFLLSDTVGFISELPHNLVKAFRTTLDEVREADLLLHVVDYANPNHLRQMEVTNETLRQIGAEKVPMIYVFNKAELTSTQLPLINHDKAYISAGKKIGIAALAALISNIVFQGYVLMRLLLPYEKGELFSYLKSEADVKSFSYEEDGILIDVELNSKLVKDFQRYEVKDKSYNF